MNAELEMGRNIDEKLFNDLIEEYGLIFENGEFYSLNKAFTGGEDI